MNLLLILSHIKTNFSTNNYQMIMLIIYFKLLLSELSSLVMLNIIMQNILDVGKWQK